MWEPSIEQSSMSRKPALRSSISRASWGPGTRPWPRSSPAGAASRTPRCCRSVRREHPTSSRLCVVRTRCPRGQHGLPQTCGRGSGVVVAAGQRSAGLTAPIDHQKQDRPSGRPWHDDMANSQPSHRTHRETISQTLTSVVSLPHRARWYRRWAVLMGCPGSRRSSPRWRPSAVDRTIPSGSM